MPQVLLYEPKFATQTAKPADAASLDQQRHETAKHGLEGQWHRGEDVATEDLRIALQQYRSFFDRLLST